MIIYHEASKESLKSLLENGLKCDSSGAKSDALIGKVDTFLDTHIPKNLQEKGLSRKTCVYGYVGNAGHIIDIKTGKTAPLPHFTAKSGTALLQLKVNESLCFVSNLDKYDEIKSRTQKGVRLTKSDAHVYWSAVIPLLQFSAKDIRRPEIMIPFSIAPEDIQIVK